MQTATTIRYSGRDFTVEQIDPETSKYSEFKAFRPVYIMTGPRGARYGLVRDRKMPHMLYPINLDERGYRFGNVLRGWFSDEGGQLRQTHS